MDSAAGVVVERTKTGASDGWRMQRAVIIDSAAHINADPIAFLAEVPAALEA